MNSWDERYSTAGYFGTEPNEFLCERSPAIRRVVDVLCLAEGERRNAVFLAQQGSRPVAVDQSAGGRRPADLRRELERLEPVHAMERERIVHEGGAHAGMSAVAQLVAYRRP
jgi:hypothetical protein